MRRWDSLLENYLCECKQRGLSEVTIDMLYRELSKWGLWLKKKKPKPKIENINIDHIVPYIKSRSAFRSKTTVYGVISKLRGMGNFLVSQGLWQQNYLKWMKGPKIDPRAKLPRRINKSHIQKIWIEASKIKDEYKSHLFLLVLSILYTTGIRRGEFDRLKLGDWNHTEKYLKIDGKKTGRERHIPLPDFVCKSLEAYLPIRYNLLSQLNIQNVDDLFITQRGKPFNGIKISKMIHRLSLKANIPIVTLHQFRHSCASDLLEEGICMPEVQKILGHASISTTFRYIHISDPEKKRAMDIHPINKIIKQEVLK